MENVVHDFVFSQHNLKIAKEIVAKYPEGRHRSAIMPLLTLAQKQNNNYLSKGCIKEVASFLDVPVLDVLEVANFYSMYNLNPVGKYHFQVCDSVSCLIVGSQTLYEFLRKILNVEENNVSKDGMFSVKKVECLGACVNMVALKVNDMFIDDSSEDNLKKIVYNLKNDIPLKLDKIVKISNL